MDGKDIYTDKDDTDCTKKASAATKIFALSGYSIVEKTTDTREEPSLKKKKKLTFNPKIDIIYVENYKQFNQNSYLQKKQRIHCDCTIV